VNRSAFLGRSVWDLEFSGSLVPERVELTLTGDGPLTIFDSSFPVILDPAGTKARIVVGRQPPLPLDLRITLPARTRARLEVRVEGSPVGGTDLEVTDWIRLAP
jgi:hypothetical protein